MDRKEIPSKMYLQRNYLVWYKLFVIYNCKLFLKVSSWELRSLDKLGAVFSSLQSFLKSRVSSCQIYTRNQLYHVLVLASLSEC